MTQNACNRVIVECYSSKTITTKVNCLKMNRALFTDYTGDEHFFAQNIVESASVKYLLFPSTIKSAIYFWAFYTNIKT